MAKVNFRGLLMGRRRIELKLDLIDVAVKIGKSISYVSRMENGETTLTDEIELKLIKILWNNLEHYHLYYDTLYKEQGRHK